MIPEIADVSNAPFHNISEITEDSGPDEDSDPSDGSGSSDTFDDTDVTNDEDPNDEDDSDFADVDVTPEYDLALIKTFVSASPSPADLGSVMTYTITVMNQGNVPSGAYQVSEMIPAGMSFDSATATPAGTVITAPAVGAGGTVVFDVPAISGLGAGAQTTFDVLLKVEDVGQSPFTNIAEITEDSGDDADSDPTDGSGSTDTVDDTDVTLDVGPGDQDDSDFDEQTIEVRYDLALIKQMKSGTPIDLNTGGQNTFEIVVKNQGNVDSGAFSVTDMIPAGMSYVSSVPAADAPAAAGTTGLLTWSIPATSELAPMAMMTIELVLQVDDPTQATFRNWAEIETDSSGDYGVTDDDSTPGTNDGNDSGPGDNGDGSDPVINHNDIDHDDPTYSDAADDEDDSDYEDLEVRYDLALVKTLAPGQSPWVVAGSSVNYQVTIKNQGNVPSLGFEVIDTLPVGMSWVSATGPGFVCVHDGSVTGGSATCTYTPPATGDLAPGATVVLDLTLMVDDLVNATFTNWAEISSDSSSDYGVTDDDSTPGDHGASDTGPGDTSSGGDPSIDHDDIDHDDSAYDDATEDEDDSDPASIYAASTTPVTLQTFTATLSGDQVSIYFSTSTEESNIGFHVYGRKNANSRWFRLNDEMILATDTGNTGGTYSLLADARGAKQFAVSDIDAFGKETPHGPFKAGQIYGRNPNDPGESIIEDADDLEIEGDVEEVAAAASNVAHIRVSNAGIQQVTAQALKDAGVNLIGTPVADLALTWNDTPLPIWIGNGDVAKLEGTLKRNDVIEFLAVVEETMYRDYAVYRLFADSSQAVRVLERSAVTAGTTVSNSGQRSVEWAPNNLYGRNSALDDAWYAKRLTALIGSVEHTAVITTPRLDSESQTDATVKVTVWGASDEAAISEDHHVKVYVNDQEIADVRFDGMTAKVIETSVPASTLSRKNSVRVEAVNDGGAGVSAVAIESIEIRYPSELSLKNGRATFIGQAPAFNTTGQGDASITVWSNSDQGMTRSVSADGSFNGSADEATYYVTTLTGCMLRK